MKKIILSMLFITIVLILGSCKTTDYKTTEQVQISVEENGELNLQSDGLNEESLMNSANHNNKSPENDSVPNTNELEEVDEPNIKEKIYTDNEESLMNSADYNNKSPENDSMPNTNELEEVDELNIKEKIYTDSVWGGGNSYDIISLDSIYVLNPNNYKMPKILREGDSFGSLILSKLVSSDMYISDEYFCPSLVVGEFSGEYEITGDLKLLINNKDIEYEEGYFRAEIKTNSSILPVTYGLYEDYNDMQFNIQLDENFYKSLGLDEEDLSVEFAEYYYKGITLKCRDYLLFYGETDIVNTIRSAELIHKN